MRREKPPGRQKGARLFSMLLAVCLMIAALPLSVSAAGEYVPGNPRWSGYQNQVQWDRPAGAASGDSFEYEAQLLLGDDVVESKAVEIDTYLFFTNDVVTRPQEEYTIRVRARWIMIVGDPDGQYMVADVGEWGPWATKAGSGGGEAEPPHEHSYTQKHDAAQHWQACSCGDKKDAADHSFGAWTADGNTESRTCTVCGYAETRDAAQTSATGETTDNGQDSGGEGIAELTDENTGVSVSLSEAVPEGVELYAGVMEAESLLEEKPELKEELDGLLSVYEISIRQNGEPVEIKDSAMTVRIPMNSHLEGYAHYQAVRVDGEPERIEAKAEDGSLVFEAGGPGRYAVLGSDTPFSVSAIIQPDPLPGDEKDGNAVYIVLLAAIPAAVLLALLLVFLYRKKRKAQDNPPAGGKDPLFAKERMKMLRKKSLLALLLSLCMVVGILPATVFAAGAGMPQNIRWAESPKSMVQWDAPSGGGQYQYELRLKLGETIIDGPDLTVQRYHLFNGSLMTEARENYTVEIRARSCIIVGEFPNEYVTSPGEWGDWATLEGSGGGEGPTPPHEHSFGGWK